MFLSLVDTFDYTVILHCHQRTYEVGLFYLIRFGMDDS